MIAEFNGILKQQKKDWWVCSIEYGERWASIERKSQAHALLAALRAVEYPLDELSLIALDDLERRERGNTFLESLEE